MCSFVSQRSKKWNEKVCESVFRWPTKPPCAYSDVFAQQIEIAHDVCLHTVWTLSSFYFATIWFLWCYISYKLLAPALEAIEYYEMDFEYSMRQFSGPPTDEREKAWDDIFVLGHRLFPFLWLKTRSPPLPCNNNENTGESILVEAWAMPMLNRTNLEQFEKASPEQGDGYLALFEFHGQLGCLVSDCASPSRTLELIPLSLVYPGLMR